jgi:hypothetical protein
MGLSWTLICAAMNASAVAPVSFQVRPVGLPSEAWIESHAMASESRTKSAWTLSGLALAIAAATGVLRGFDVIAGWPVAVGLVAAAIVSVLAGRQARRH